MRLLFALLVFCTVSSQADIYKWTDANGRLHYGSKAEQDSAQPLKIRTDKAQALKSQTAIVMYATRWCPYCAKARAYFKSKNIAYTEYDIETSASAKQAYDKLGGKGVPVILLGSNRLDGFNVERFETLYQDAFNEN